MIPIYHIKNRCAAIISVHNSLADAQQRVHQMEISDKENNCFLEGSYTIVKISGGVKLIGSIANFPCRCFETNKKIFKGDSYFFDVVNKRPYHNSADIVRIYYSNSLTN